jgi:hypothetical protein
MKTISVHGIVDTLRDTLEHKFEIEVRVWPATGHYAYDFILYSLPHKKYIGTIKVDAYSLSKSSSSKQQAVTLMLDKIKPLIMEHKLNEQLYKH